MKEADACSCPEGTPGIHSGLFSLRLHRGQARSHKLLAQ
jgi:hypothetical protein